MGKRIERLIASRVSIREMRLRPLAGRLGLVLASILLTVAVLEAGLRLSGYRFSPVVLLPGPDGSDFRAFHIEDDPLVVFDHELFWRPNPAAWVEMDERGLRGPQARGSGELLVLAIGDSNTIGAPGPGQHWPADLQRLLERNRPGRPVRVLNAGCVGWGSLQGLRRFHQLLDLRPAVAFFSFGANEAHRVVQDDADYARRTAWLRRLGGLRLAAPVAHRLWSLADHGRDQRPRPRVSLRDHRAHLEEFVDTARTRGVTPVLLTRPYVGVPEGPEHWMTWAGGYRKATRDVAAAKGAAFVDVHRAFEGKPQLFEGESHFNRVGRLHMAALLLRELKEQGHVATDYIYEPALEPGRVEDSHPELGPGWWSAERWSERGWGRWSAREAVLYLERRNAEDGLEVDLSLLAPQGRNVGRVVVNGRAVGAIDSPNGPWRRVLDVGPVPGRELTVRLVMESAFVPREVSKDNNDSRTLGVFVHALRLVRSGGGAPGK
jgi:lysophospholipase L1-like esterase